MQSVALIDYGSGNLRSAEKALQKAAAGLARRARASSTTDDPETDRRGRPGGAAGRRRLRRLHGGARRPAPGVDRGDRPRR